MKYNRRSFLKKLGMAIGLVMVAPLALLVKDAKPCCKITTKRFYCDVEETTQKGDEYRTYRQGNTYVEISGTTSKPIVRLIHKKGG